jgi:ABC-type molybdenum transport system ATPase subunit/photorepair protein PhrA
MPTLVNLDNAVFRQVGKTTKQIFKAPISFSVNSNERWAVLGSSKTQFLKALASQYNAEPPLSRTYPFLNKSIWPSSAIQFLEFKGVLPTAHLAARYEFFKDEFDETTRKFIIGNVNNHRHINDSLVDDLLKKFRLEGLEDRWAMGLSNGQTRRARFARALVREPRLLVIDDPFLGLDPSASAIVSEVLEEVSPNPYVILGLRVQDEIPAWVTNLVIVEESGIVKQGTVDELRDYVEDLKEHALQWHKEELERQSESIENMKKLFPGDHIDRSTPLLEFCDISVSYRGQPVLKDLRWRVLQGERWHIRGNNGTGKSTLLSLITGEHPQSWNSKIVMNGVPRKTGLQSFFDINESIGFTSPELHSIYPNSHTLYQAISTGYVTGSMIPPRELSDEQKSVIDTYLKEFNLEDKRDVTFRDLSISDQKLALFIRALVKNPQLVILDEALSVMEEHTVQKCKELLRHYPGAVLAIGHLADEVPETDQFIRLIAPGECEIGQC